MATTVIGALSVEITADTKGVRAGIKASGEALKIGGKQLRESANRWGKWALAATAAAAGVAAAILKSNLSAIKELKNAALAADTQVAAFERGAFAANAFGVSTEKYGDVLKDVNDRIGDFLVSGAGPMVDFFEVIAPKVGITADAFKGLSGQESLGLYIKTLEEAGVTQQEMTFFMETLAGDSIRLAPLFQNNAKAFNALTKEAKDLGIGLSDIDVAKAELASAEIAKAAGVVDSLTKQATVELAPIIAAITDLFVDMAKEAGGASQFIRNGIANVISVVGVFADGIQGVRFIFKGLELTAKDVIFSISKAFDVLAFGSIQEIGRAIADFIISPLTTTLEIFAIFSDTAEEALGTVDQFMETVFGKSKESLNDFAQAQKDAFDQTKKELDAIAAEGLPSEKIKTFVNEAVQEYEKLAAAKAKALGTDKLEGEGVGTKKTSQIEVFEAETIGLLEALGLRFQSEEEMQLAHLMREQEQLDAARANGELTAIQHSEKMAEIKQAEEDIKRNITLMGVQQGFQVLASGSKKIQKLMAAAATIQAVIKGKQAAVDAWQAGMSVGGPFAPVVAAAYAAASLAQTGSIIKSINSGSKSQGSISGGGFSTGSAGQAVPQQAQQQTPQAQQQSQNVRRVSLNLIGSNALTALARELIEPLNEAFGDGFELKLEG